MSPIAIGVIATVILLSLGGADYALLERPHQQQLNAQQVQNPQMGSSSSSGVKKGHSIRKQAEIDIPTTLSTLHLSPVDTQEVSILSKIVTTPSVVQTKVLLKNNDRSALFAWTESMDSKALFNQLKQSLQQSFSPQVHDVQDERIEPDTGTTYDILRFTDNAISPETMVFLRVRTRIYELHISAGQQQTIDQLIAALVA